MLTLGKQITTKNCCKSNAPLQQSNRYKLIRIKIFTT